MNCGVLRRDDSAVLFDADRLGFYCFVVAFRAGDILVLGTELPFVILFDFDDIHGEYP